MSGYREEDFESKKEDRKRRKILQKKDRSKFKKTDLEKRKQNIPQSADLKRGRVIEITSQFIKVDCENKLFKCVLRGVLKKEKRKVKNLVTIGDFVYFKELGDDEGVIFYVEERKSFLSRAETLTHRSQHLIAANIDQVLITVSVVDPKLRPSLVDRYIIAAQKGNMTPIVVVNKIDLLSSSEEEKKLFDEFLKAYEIAKITVIPVCALSGKGLELLKEVMKGKSSVFSGQSGVGKSSLINAMTGLNLPTGATVSRTKKGSHITTRAKLVPLSFGGFCVDTPGIKSFGVWELKKEWVKQYFSEIEKYSQNCQFSDCLHIVEKNCAVKKALDEGKISSLRYRSYVSLINEIEKEHKRR